MSVRHPVRRSPRSSGRRDPARLRPPAGRATGPPESSHPPRPGPPPHILRVVTVPPGPERALGDDAPDTAVPPPVRDALAALAARTGAPALLVRGLRLPGDVPPTPERRGSGPAPAVLDTWLSLLAGPLGRAFTWRTLQDGAALIGDVLPVRGFEHEQTGLGSVPLLPHVEDAWHPRRCDHLLLGCVRNTERAPTTLVTAADLATLPPADLRVLAEPRFTIEVDPAHRRGACPGAPHRVPAAVGPVAALTLDDTGRPAGLRIDQAFTTTRPGDAEAERALARLYRRMAEAAVPVVLEPGDVLVVDNTRCAHGRGRIAHGTSPGARRWVRRLMTSLHPGPEIADPAPAGEPVTDAPHRAAATARPPTGIAADGTARGGARAEPAARDRP